jgi:hypothetical protein
LLHGKFVADGRVVESGLDGLQHRTDCVTQRLLLLQNPQRILGQLLQICSRRRPRTKQKKYTKLMHAQSELRGTAPWDRTIDVAELHCGEVERPIRVAVEGDEPLEKFDC